MANGDTPDAPLLAFYRSEHVNQNWLATLMVIVDVAAFIKDAFTQPLVNGLCAAACHKLSPASGVVGIVLPVEPSLRIPWRRSLEVLEPFLKIARLRVYRPSAVRVTRHQAGRTCNERVRSAWRRGILVACVGGRPATRAGPDLRRHERE